MFSSLTKFAVFKLKGLSAGVVIICSFPFHPVLKAKRLIISSMISLSMHYLLAAYQNAAFRNFCLYVIPFMVACK